MRLDITDHLAEALKEALTRAGLPIPESVFWEVPREERHGDYATNVAMTLARPARQPPRKVAEAIVSHFPETAAVERIEIAGPGFLNVFLRPRWCAEALREILRAGAAYGTSAAESGRRYLLECVREPYRSAGDQCRAAAVGDAPRVSSVAGETVETSTTSMPATSSRPPAPFRGAVPRWRGRGPARGILSGRVPRRSGPGLSGA
jgi:arginyl-tRNA synthetase